MQILHLNWINKEKDKNFFLWGEATRETAAKKRTATAKHTLHPCKYIAAVHYVLADEFDRDPFMIFKMRGKSKDEIIGDISKQWTETSGKEESPLKDPQQKQKIKKIVPLEECIHKFWKSDDKLQKFHIDIQPPEVPLALIRRLGPPSFWHGSPDFHKEMERIYRIVTKKVMDIAYRD